jgi:outer membrane protein
MTGVKVVTGAAAAVLLVAYMGLAPALGDTIEAALVRAYQNNPQLNAQRAQVRSTDENVPQALAATGRRLSPAWARDSRRCETCCRTTRFNPRP